jgi:ABC-type Na+ efflux pump permease subunit
MKPNLKLYRLSVGVLSLIFFGSALFAFVDRTGQVREFQELNYPGYIPIPLAIAKLAGIIALVSRKSRELKDLAMAGFLFDMILAAVALRDGRASIAIVGLAVWVVVYWQDKLLFPMIPAPDPERES